jgi:hypothetical protein
MAVGADVTCVLPVTVCMTGLLTLIQPGSVAQAYWGVILSLIFVSIACVRECQGVGCLASALKLHCGCR